MNFDAATMTLSLDLLATTGIGCIMVFLGKAIVRRVKPFQDWGIPAPVIGGLFAGAIARNVLEGLHVKFNLQEVETIEHVSLAPGFM